MCVVDVVRGVTYLDNIMYVVCDRSSTIRLYNMDTYSPLDVVINVSGMKCPWDMVVSRDDHQLFIADHFECIWQVSVVDHTYVKWLTRQSTMDTFNSLSLTSRRLLVTSSRSHHLHQYDVTDRQLLRVVDLSEHMGLVSHAVETTRGTFVICRHGTLQNQPQYAVSENSFCHRCQLIQTK